MARRVGTVTVRTSYTLNQENTGSNPFPSVSELWQVRSSQVVIVHSAVYMSTWLQTGVYIGNNNNIRAVIAAWMNASHVILDGVRINMSARGCIKHVEQSEELDTALYKIVPFY